MNSHAIPNFYRGRAEIFKRPEGVLLYRNLINIIYAITVEYLN